MHEYIDEPIRILVDFDGTKILPRKFLWRSVQYVVSELTMVHTEIKGRDRVYYFSITDGTHFFKLCFFTKDLTWRLREVYCD